MQVKPKVSLYQLNKYLTYLKINKPKKRECRPYATFAIVDVVLVLKVYIYIFTPSRILNGENCKPTLQVLEHLWNNLISNAIKYSNKDGKIDITLTSDNDSVVVKVKDNGIGMSEESLNQIFDRFYQVDKSQLEYLL